MSEEQAIYELAISIKQGIDEDDGYGDYSNQDVYEIILDFINAKSQLQSAQQRIDDYQLRNADLAGKLVDFQQREQKLIKYIKSKIAKAEEEQPEAFNSGELTAYYIVLRQLGVTE